jgi:DNA-binding CsgD family transcriptional regulator
VELRIVKNAPLHGHVLQAYHGFVDSVGADEHPRQCIEHAIRAIAPIDRFYLSERNALSAPPTLIAHRVEGILAGRVGDYMTRYFRRDPVVDVLEKATENGATLVLRVGPRDIAEREYRRSFFDEPAVIERVSFVQKYSGRWQILNVTRCQPSKAFSEEELASLACLSQLLLPLASRQAELERQAGRRGAVGVGELERRFAAIFPALTPRERQVCARTVVGMTSEATAIDLGIGIGSVQTYRKRAFQRLEIGSAFQLAQLVMH